MMCQDMYITYSYYEYFYTAKGGSSSYSLEAVLLYFQLRHQYRLLLLHMVNNNIVPLVDLKKISGIKFLGLS